MKILCLFSPGGSVFVRKGWGRALKAAGHDFVFWDPQTKPAHDAFAEFEPDLAILTTYDTDRAVEKCIRNWPDMRVIMFGSAWGELPDKMDKEQYPIVRVSEEEKGRLEKLKQETGRPDYVFIHVTDKYLEPTMGGWQSIGIQPHGILNAFDSVLYANATPREELKCDVGFVGSRWGYKGRNLDKYILPLCNSDLNVKIFGFHGWGGIPEYLGRCSDADNRDLFVSATVCPNVSEPHSTDYGFDLVERPLKVMGAGGFVVSDFVDEARTVFMEEEMLMCDDAASFHDAVRHYVKHPEERLSFIEKGQKKVLAHHTYFDRAAQMFDLLGDTDQAENIRKAKENETHLLP